MEEKQTRLQQARDWYLDAVDAIPADKWKGATLCAGWTPAHVVAHVATGDQLFRAVIMDATGRDRSGLDLPVDFADRQRRFQELTPKDSGTLKKAAHHEAKGTGDAIVEG